jgi:hypothetical protein
MSSTTLKRSPRKPAIIAPRTNQMTQTTVRVTVSFPTPYRKAPSQWRAPIAGAWTETRSLKRSTTEHGCHAENTTTESRWQAYVHVLRRALIVRPEPLHWQPDCDARSASDRLAWSQFRDFEPSYLIALLGIQNTLMGNNEVGRCSKNLRE